MGVQNTVSVEEGFRESLKDFVTVSKALSPICHSTDELIQIVELALENDGQLKIIMGMVESFSKGKR